MSLDGHSDKLEVELFKNEEKGILYKLSVTEFRGKSYLSVREWYLDFEGEYAATKNGFTVPYTIDTTLALFNALAELLSQAEVLEILLEKRDNERTN